MNFAGSVDYLAFIFTDTTYVPGTNSLIKLSTATTTDPSETNFCALAA